VQAPPAGCPLRVGVDSHELSELRDGWEAASSAPGEHGGPGDIAGMAWAPVRVPGAAAAVLCAAGAPPWELPPEALDGRDWWFRLRFEGAAAAAGEEVVLVFEGVATVAEIYLNGELIHESGSMFAAASVEVGGLLAGHNELAVCCRALAPLLARPRRPRARWRTRVVADGGLRFHRTMIMGRAPGFAAAPALVGPWRAVRLERRRELVPSELTLRPRLEGTTGVLALATRLRVLAGPGPTRVAVELQHDGERHHGALELSEEGGGSVVLACGEIRVPDAALWWPHTHGPANLYRVLLHAESRARSVRVDCGKVGFRTLAGGECVDRDGLELAVNGVPLFLRGAVWTPLEASGLATETDELHSTLEAMREAGMNMVRIPGTAAYESSAFHDLCDELGVLVWQDLMFANLDYPEGDPQFMETVAAEVREVLGELGGRPSLAVVCGSSEVAQQVAMLGLPAGLASGPLFGELLPELVRDARLDAVYVPSTPSGGDLPFHPGRGIAHYYGVGAYRRPLSDARTASVRFAAECLALANVPDTEALEELAAGGVLAVGGAAWKGGVPRDVGSGWDFDDVRDHYLEELFGLDARALRASDPERYLELSRALSGELMSAVMGEWRRTESPCAGALILWLRDLRPGAGWGVLDHRGRAKVAYHHLRRALAPVAVWGSDEGLSGIVAHVANDGPETLALRLRASLYSDFERAVGEAGEELEVAPHSQCARNVEALLGRFVDVSWAYRFGAPAQDLVVLTLEGTGERVGEILSQSFHFPAGRPLAREQPERLGLGATLRQRDDVSLLTVRSRRFAYGVRVHLQGFVAADDAFSVEPGGERTVALRALGDAAAAPGGSLTALNLSGRVPILGDA
jgi:beta-mannosidase